MIMVPTLSSPLRASLTFAALLLAAVAPTSAQQATGERFDVLIRDGRVIDGSGNPWFRADVGIRDGRIAAVGLLSDATAARVIEADGKIVAPGFIDIHSHADDGSARVGGATIRTDSLRRKAMPNIVGQGVTTVVVNHDGRSPWPIASQRDVLRRQGLGANVGLMVGHGEVRRQVMDDDFMRPATADEVERMQALVRQALEEGAVGMSAGLEYVPGRWSTLDEVAALAGELAPYDAVYISHQRSEGSDPMWFWPSQDEPGAPTLLDAISETIEIGRRSGARVVASHIKAKGAHYWGSSHAAIQQIERARAEGVRVWADQYPYPTSGSDGNTVLIPRWALQDEAAQSREDARPPGDVLEAHLNDPETAAAIRRDITHEIRRRGGAERVVVFEYPDETLVGLSVAEIAARWDVDAVDAAIRLQLRGDRGRNGGGRMRGFSMSEDDVETYGALPWVATASDGGLAHPDDRGSVHPRFYGTFPRKIAYYARDRGVLTVEDAVRSMTSLPAVLMGFDDRGSIREGYRADVVVFDLDELEDRTTFFEPHAYPSGIEHVLVNGEAVVENGELTWALPGAVLTRGRAIPASQPDA
ncbi:MAG: amidohydrolase family protein [Gemmatimonadetes bacterium]|nr:amidohydrolase family protein [Gemmatimonadota bacterium]